MSWGTKVVKKEVDVRSRGDGRRNRRLSRLDLTLIAVTVGHRIEIARLGHLLAYHVHVLHDPFAVFM